MKVRPMKLLPSLLCLLLALPAAAQLYQPGEVLSYRVSYKAKMFPNTEVATVQISTATEELDGETYYRVEGYGRTLPTYRWFFPIDDRYIVWADTLTLRTRFFESDVHEGEYTFTSRYRYDWPAMRVHTRWQKRKNPENRKTMALTPGSMDPVSLYFNMRTLDPADFREGESRVLEMLLQDTVRYLKYRFMGREEKKIRTMGRFRTLKFMCQIGTSDGYSFTDGSEFTLWISDDQNKIPLYIESPIRVGSIQAYITAYKGLKYPLASKIK